MGQEDEDNTGKEDPKEYKYNGPSTAQRYMSIIPNPPERSNIATIGHEIMKTSLTLVAELPSKNRDSLHLSH